MSMDLMEKIHSKRVKKTETTLETSEEDGNYTQKERRRWELNSKRVKKMRTTLETRVFPTINS